MAHMSKKEYSKYFFLAFFALLIVLAFLLIQPFLTSIFLALIFAYALYPLYSKLNLKLKHPTISSIIMVVFTFLVIAIPTYFIINSLITETVLVYNYISEISSKIPPELSDVIQKGATNFLSTITPSLTSLKDAFFSFFIFLFFLFYFFREGNEIMSFITKKVPLAHSQKNSFLHHFKKITFAVLYGYIFVGIIVGILAALGFSLLGVSSPIFWAIIVMILSILPIFGATLVWVPMVITEIISHNYTQAILITLFGLVVLEGVEALLKPKLIGEKAKIHPLVIVVGVFGGLKVLGITGVIFGPFILVVVIEVINLIIKNKSTKIV